MDIKVVQPSTKQAKPIQTGSLKTIIDSDLFAVLAWKSKVRTLKYFMLALITCILNVGLGFSFTVLLLLGILLFRGPRILINLWRARRAEKAREKENENDEIMKDYNREELLRQETDKADDDLELISEDHLAQFIIAVYLGLNHFLEVTREIVQFERPLMCFAKSLIFLGVSAVATLIGDMNVLWITIFLSFFAPTMLMKKDETSEQEQQSLATEKDDQIGENDLQLTERGSIIVAKFKQIFEKIHTRIPKFSEW